MNEIIDLKAMGFELSVTGDKIHYKFVGAGRPDALRAVHLLQRMKENKRTAIVYLKAAAKVEAIRNQALAAGWRPGQLEELRQALEKLPGEIGIITCEKIEIIRKRKGRLNFYNNNVAQPWL